MPSVDELRASFQKRGDGCVEVSQSVSRGGVDAAAAALYCWCCWVHHARRAWMAIAPSLSSLTPIVLMTWRLAWRLCTMVTLGLVSAAALFCTPVRTQINGTVYPVTHPQCAFGMATPVDA
jgi:hypothetical protein